MQRTGASSSLPSPRATCDDADWRSWRHTQTEGEHSHHQVSGRGRIAGRVSCNQRLRALPKIDVVINRARCEHTRASLRPRAKRQGIASECLCPGARCASCSIASSRTAWDQPEKRTCRFLRSASGSASAASLPRSSLFSSRRTCRAPLLCPPARPARGDGDGAFQPGSHRSRHDGCSVRVSHRTSISRKPDWAEGWEQVWRRRVTSGERRSTDAAGAQLRGQRVSRVELRS